jgi:Tfp pilus assembly protein FimT
MLISDRSGTSLVEIVLVLILMSTLLFLGAASYGTARDVMAVRAARDELVAASARTRALAVRHGGATLSVDGSAGSMRIATRDGAVSENEIFATDVGVRIDVDASRGASSINMQYDALGIGRLASRTITLSRGNASGGVTFSAYGRPRVW